MKIHHTKNKGDLGVLKAQVDLCEKGYLILSPHSEHSPFDLVAYKDSKFLRIQVKYRSLVDKKMLVRFSTSWADKKGNHVSFYDKDQIDLFCIYCPDTDKCYYLNPKHFEKCITLRSSDSLESRIGKFHLLDSFEDIPLVF